MEYMIKPKNQRKKSNFRRGKTINKTISLITKEMKISEVIKKYPKIFPIFLNYGFHCIGCPSALSETIDDAAKVHGVELKKLINDLNKAVK
jgi:hybrid cluster-associated redox disulfide protein